MEKERKKSVLKKYVFIIFLLVAISVSILLMVRYNVEGEKTLPFELDKLIIKSTLNAKSEAGESLWNLNLEQDNDIYIYFKKNEKFNKKIESIQINNIQIEKAKEIGNTQILLPTSNDFKALYKNSTKDCSENGFEYVADTLDNMEKQEFCQDGGMIAFRVSNQDIGKYVSNEDEEIQYNGQLLEKANIKEEEKKKKLTMDIILKVNEKEKYKGKLTIDLPANDFKEKGSTDKTITDFSNIIFKRSE